MKKIISKCKKIKAWFFMDHLELGKKWWHIFIKITFILLIIFFNVFLLMPIASEELEPDYVINKKDISIKNNLYTFTENFEGEDYNNTISRFIKLPGQFGIIENNKVKVISTDFLNSGFCIKDPEKYHDGVINIFYEYYKTTPIYEEAPVNFAVFKDLNEYYMEDIYKEKTRKCFLYDTIEYNGDFNKYIATPDNVINFKFSVFYYFMFGVEIIIFNLILFIVFSTIYYRIILYIVYYKKIKSLNNKR